MSIADNISNAAPGIGGAIGGIVGAISNRKTAKENIQLQKDFAQQGIRWKVADAQAAGIHPLYALGAQTHSFAPNPVGNDFGTIGQNIGSAVQAMTTPAEKLDGFAKTVQSLTLDKMGLENEILRSQLATLNQPGRGPGMPADRMIPGQGNSPASMKFSTLVDLPTVAGQTPAEDGEAHYGEIAGEVMGGANLAEAGILKWLGQPSWKQVKIAMDNALEKKFGGLRNVSGPGKGATYADLLLYLQDQLGVPK